MSRHSAQAKGFIAAAFADAIANRDPNVPPGAKAARGQALTDMREAWWIVASIQNPILDVMAYPGPYIDEDATEEEFEDLICCALDGQWCDAADGLLIPMERNRKPSLTALRKFHRAYARGLAYENLHQCHGNITPTPAGVYGLKRYHGDEVFKVYTDFLKQFDLSLPAAVFEDHTVADLEREIQKNVAVAEKDGSPDVEEMQRDLATLKAGGRIRPNVKNEAKRFECQGLPVPSELQTELDEMNRHWEKRVSAYRKMKQAA